MSADQIASALWRRRLIFLATFVACLIAVVVVTASLPRTYRATATLYVGDEGSRRALEFNSSLGESLTRTYSTLAGNPNVADEVLQDIPYRMSRSQLLARMSFAPVERTQLLQIGAEGTSREQAQRIANTYAIVFARRVDSQFARKETQSQVSINEPASLPAGAFKPNPPLYIGLGGLVALFLAVGVVLVRERLDKTIKIADEDDSVLGRPIVGRIPRIAGRLGDTAPEVNDAFRLLKTTLDFTDDEPVRALMVTSPGPVEGKTKIAANLATVDALDGERVVIVEGDLRRPGLGGTGIAHGLDRSEVGITNYLVGAATEDEIVMPHPEIPNLHVIWSGPTPPNPAALLRSPRFPTLLESLRMNFDRIIIDTPPVSVGADASTIGSVADATLYVVDVRNTARSKAQAGLNQLAKVRVNVLGIVLNNLPHQNFKGYYGPQGPVVARPPVRVNGEPRRPRPRTRA
jgi:capsular exopolysaccharide synthesis family protein